MKRCVLLITGSLLVLSLLSGCIHLKEFTPDELDRLSYTGTSQVRQ
ncbi:hypothetical protein [Marispirochaeta sp.]|nr:hypothetical protein [Marispirochaeta sp.]